MPNQHERTQDSEYKGTIADYDYFLQHQDDQDDDEGGGYRDLYNATSRPKIDDDEGEDEGEDEEDEEVEEHEDDRDVYGLGGEDDYDDYGN
jgi:hypothetical protein